MEKTVTIKASEDEILKLINDHFGTSEDSIVALEELGNQYWYVNVDSYDKSANPIRYDRYTGSKVIEKYLVRDALSILCKEGILEKGEYIIDCTW